WTVMPRGGHFAAMEEPESSSPRISAHSSGRSGRGSGPEVFPGWIRDEPCGDDGDEKEKSLYRLQARDEAPECPEHTQIEVAGPLVIQVRKNAELGEREPHDGEPDRHPPQGSVARPPGPDPDPGAGRESDKRGHVVDLVSGHHSDDDPHGR